MQMTKAFGAYFLMPAPTCSMTLRLMPSRSSRLMPGLRGTPAVTMHDVGARDRRRRRWRPDSAASKPSTGADCGDVERLALRNALRDVEQHDVAEFLEAGEMGERAADLAGADQRDFLARHGLIVLLEGRAVRSFCSAKATFV